MATCAAVAGAESVGPALVAPAGEMRSWLLHVTLPARKHKGCRQGRGHSAVMRSSSGSPTGFCSVSRLRGAGVHGVVLVTQK